MKKKIFLVLPTLTGGGAEKFIIELANTFAKKGFDTYLVLITENSNDCLQDISPLVSLLRLKQKKILHALRPLSHLFKKHKPNVILSTMTHLNILCILAKILSGVNLSVFVREANVFSHHDKLKNKIAKVAGRVVYPFASGVISPSQDVHKDNIKLRLRNKKMAVIYNFVNKPQLEQLATSPCDLPGNFANPLMLAAGRLAKKKNHAYLIKSFHVFCQKYNYPHAKLIILGKGPEQANLEKLIQKLNLQDKVLLKGFIKNPYPYFAKADLFVHSSKAEGLANVLLAALALEKNIITTDCAGSSEALANGTYGRLIPITDDLNILAKAMFDALQHPIDKQLLAQSVESLSVENVVQKYINFMGLNNK